MKLRSLHQTQLTHLQPCQLFLPVLLLQLLLLTKLTYLELQGVIHPRTRPAAEVAQPPRLLAIGNVLTANHTTMVLPTTTYGLYARRLDLSYINN